jgi:Na+/H+ antiporter NhaD/arsenite permease-like protein
MRNTLIAADYHETAAGAAVHLLQSSQHLPPVWLAAPFILLLLMIATGPLVYAHFWEHHYAKVSIGLGAVVAAYYLLVMDQGARILLHSLEEYLSFLALITALFVVSGCIYIRIERRGSPVINGALLLAGALVSNIIGTTGASMLFIRPYLRINEGRMKAFHIVFFIFIVSNIGGALTPIGDPPLFLGFLKGVPFFWVTPKVWFPWILTLAGLILIFIVLDSRVGKGVLMTTKNSGKVRVVGAKSFIFLAMVIGAVFLDPAVIPGFPSLQVMMHLPFGIRELIMFTVAFTAYKTADKEALKSNEFNFLPIREVAFLFIGIFATMIPALQLVGAYASTHAGELSVTRFYWMTGALSGVLDNAPTYLSFLAGASGKFGMNINSVSDIQKLSGGISSPVHGDVTSDIYLMAISLASVFFGSLTYIGNAPNFMVKNIALQAKVEVPEFIEYIYKYSLPVLMPFFALIWWLFFNY